MPSVPGETTVPVGDWTTGTLKIYHDAVIGYERQVANERDKRYHERWRAQEAATKYSQEKSNEFRGALDDLSSKMATKIELTTAVATLSEKIDIQSGLIAELRSRLDVGNPDIRKLQTVQATSAGRKLGADQLFAYLIAAGSVALAVFK